MTPVSLPISAIVPTQNRGVVLKRMLEGLASQSVQPLEIVVIDASSDSATRTLCKSSITELQSRIRWIAADAQGAAAQRNQGVALATQPFILFFDDDIVFEPNCVAKLWQAIQSDQQLGGVNAMIVNQRYHSPGIISRIMFTLVSGRREKTFAGRVIGPAVNLLPEDRPDLPEVVPVQWLNTTCTLYRREALPTPPFRPEFTGYSLMEDLALSLEVGKSWTLANARTARIFHDSQPADYKSDARSGSCMELVNRHFVMTRIMGKSRPANYLGLFLWEFFSIASALTNPEGRKSLLYILRGKWDGMRRIVAGGRAGSRERGAGSGSPGANSTAGGRESGGCRTNRPKESCRSAANQKRGTR